MGGVTIPDLNGKVALVTGGNAGIGASLVKALAAHNPSTIYLCARSESKARTSIETILKTHPRANIEFLQLDLNSFPSVKKCAEGFTSKSDRLDLLFDNAGISSTPPSLTEEGYESQFGVNHMGHALLTQLLLPTLLKTQKEPGADVRIIVCSSLAAHQLAPKGGLLLDKMKTTAESYNTLARYGHSKLANALFAKKLAQQYPDIVTTSHHPGIVKSEIWGKANGIKLLATMMTPIVWLAGVTTDQGAQAGLWCAVTPKDKIQNGHFYEPVGKLNTKTKYCENQKLADELWEWTNKELASHGAPGWP